MENHQIINNNSFNIGIAVDTDRGLLVPVIKNADKKNITEISVELSDISERSRNKKIKVDELQGSTFTITNLGGMGGTYFTPVINFPNVSILGLSRSSFEPIYKDGEFKPRLMLPLSLSYDHRIIDGADAIRFLRWIIEGLENPFFTLLDS
jgi:pyruvate dehydrogenase E2 component (dihydrolipoamide acetyltransferase)